MAKSPLGLFAGRVLKAKKKKQRWSISTFKRRKLGLDKKSNPFGVFALLDPALTVVSHKQAE